MTLRHALHSVWQLYYSAGQSGWMSSGALCYTMLFTPSKGCRPCSNRHTLLHRIHTEPLDTIPPLLFLPAASRPMLRAQL